MPHLRGSPEPNLMRREPYDVAGFELAAEKLCSCAESRQPMTGLVIALEMLAGKVEERHDEAGTTGRVEEGGQLGRLRIQDLGGLHLGLPSESLVLGLVVLLSDLAGVCDRPAFVA